MWLSVAQCASEPLAGQDSCSLGKQQSHISPIYALSRCCVKLGEDIAFLIHLGWVYFELLGLLCRLQQQVQSRSCTMHGMLHYHSSIEEHKTNRLITAESSYDVMTVLCSSQAVRLRSCLTLLLHAAHVVLFSNN